MQIASIPSQIQAVTVFRKGALVRRTAVITGQSTNGSSHVKLSNLPLGLDDSSVRVKCLAHDHQPPIAEQVRVVLEVVATGTVEEPPQEQELKAAQLREEKLGAKLQIYRTSKEQLMALHVQARPKSKKKHGSPTQARLALLRFQAQELDRVTKQIQQCQRELNQAIEERKAMAEAVRIASSAKQARENELRKAVVIQLLAQSDTQQDFEIILEYQVSGARWTPSYTIHLDRDLKQASLGLRALIAQQTGEDWHGVQITLSTAEPQRWNELPTLQSIRIGRAVRQPHKQVWRPAPQGSERLYQDYDRSLPPKKTPMVEQLQEQANNAFLETSKASVERTEDVLDSLEEMEEPREPLPQDASVVAGKYAPMMTASAPKSSGLLGGLAGLVEGFGSSKADTDVSRRPAPMVRRKSESRSAFFDVDHQQEQAKEITVTEEVAVEVGSDLFNYMNLRMNSASSSQRGRLEMVSQKELYLQLLVEQNIQVTFNVLQTIREAQSVAQRTEHLHAPDGHCFPEDDQSYDYAYPAEHPVDVPADGVFHNVPLRTESGNTHVRYVSVPRLAAEVFRVIELDNPLQSPLLTGPVDVYLGGEFLMTSNLRFTHPRGRLELGIGVEERIKVARNTNFTEETKGLMRGSLDLNHHTQIDVLNLLPHKVTVEIRERLPVVHKEEEDITIHLEKVSPEWNVFEQREQPTKGTYHWHLELDAQQKETIHLQYRIRIPAKQELVGGNRRDNT
jgi:hypothetical protein